MSEPLNAEEGWRALAARTRHWGLSDERPDDVLLEDGSGRLILRGFHAPKGSWSGWPPPWYAKDAVEMAKALRDVLATLDRDRAAVQAPTAGEPRTLRDEGWAFAQKASDHQRGYEAGKRDALAGHFDPCATCGHERIAHYDGGNCGEEDCPQNCAAFVPKEAEAVRVYRDRVEAGIEALPAHNMLREIATGWGGYVIERDRVLALLDEEVAG